MPTKKQTEADGQVEVRALKDDASHGLAAGLLAIVNAADVPSLKESGLIDDHPDAVAFAKSSAG